MSGELKLAAEKLEQGNSLVVVHGGRTVFTSRMPGIEPLLEALDSKILPGSAVADKVVGRAAAMIAVTGKILSLYTPVMSEEAVEVLTEAGIIYCAGRIVPIILDRKKVKPCPVEAATECTIVPEKGVDAVRNLLQELQAGAKIVQMH